MTITQTKNGTNLTVALEGRLDTMTSPELEQAMRTALDDVDTLTLDLANLVYISSAGLRVLLTLHKRMAGKGGMKVIHVGEIVQEVFDVTGFSGVLTIA